MENQPPNLENKNTPVGFINLLKYAPHCCQAERACVFPLNIVEKKMFTGWLGISAVDFPGNVQGDAVIAMETSHYNSIKRKKRR